MLFRELGKKKTLTEFIEDKEAFSRASAKTKSTFQKHVNQENEEHFQDDEGLTQKTKKRDNKQSSRVEKEERKSSSQGTRVGREYIPYD